MMTHREARKKLGSRNARRKNCKPRIGRGGVHRQNLASKPRVLVAKLVKQTT